MQCYKQRLAVINCKVLRCCGKEVGDKIKKNVKDFTKCSKFKDLIKQIQGFLYCQNSKMRTNKIFPDYASLKFSLELHINLETK